MLPSYLRPYHIEIENLIRVGPDFDGGYVIHKDTVKFTDKIITLGLSDDWSFEKDFLSRKKKCKVEAYDHTVNCQFWIRRFLKDIFHFILLKKLRIKKIFDIFKYVDYLLFFRKNNHYKIKVGNKSNEINLGKIFLNTVENYKYLLKIDIEGSEYEIIDQIKERQKFINTLIIEFHEIDKKEKLNLIKDFITENTSFKLIHIHGNNYLTDSENNPKCLELTFINENIFKKLNKFSEHNYPIENLDYPNLKRKKDCIIKFE